MAFEPVSEHSGKTVTRKFIVANWKMNGSIQFMNDFIPSLKTALMECPNQVMICPPNPFLMTLKNLLNGTPVLVGAQNCSTEIQGAYTGEVSAPMLADTGCSVIITGHSERRTLFAETDAIVKAKAAAVHAAGMKAIICVGENLLSRQAGQAISDVIGQVMASLPASSTAQNTLVAYEPVWAIGTGLSASLDDIAAMHREIHAILPAGLPVLYGGSVTAENTPHILSLLPVDGVLVGGASLKQKSFEKIMGFKNIH